MPFEHGAVDVDTEADYRQLGDWTG
jgi:hypothetical protein